MKRKGQNCERASARCSITFGKCAKRERGKVIHTKAKESSRPFRAPEFRPSSRQPFSHRQSINGCPTDANCKSQRGVYRAIVFAICIHDSGQSNCIRPYAESAGYQHPCNRDQGRIGRCEYSESRQTVHRIDIITCNQLPEDSKGTMKRPTRKMDGFEVVIYLATGVCIR